VGQGLPEEHATTQDNVEVQVADPDAAIAASLEIEEKTPALTGRCKKSSCCTN
jgi:hypothetical protein